jgi:ADP-heptose:LPS heptosyltransferase
MSGGRGQRRIVLDLPNWLGDVIHTLPALARLFEPGAGATVTALLPGAYLPLVALTGAATLARPRGAGLWWARRHLDGRFDVAVTARHATRAKLLLTGCRVPLALASRGRGARLLGLRTFTVDRTRHQRHDLDEALHALGRPPVGERGVRLVLPGPLRERGLGHRHALAGTARAVVLLPGSRGGRHKRYPPGAYATAGQALARGGVAVLVAAGADEERLALRVAEGAGGRAVPAAWALEDLAALLAVCDAAIGNDSGLTHLAAAVGTPTLALFGPTDEARTAPGGRVVVLRPPPRWPDRLERLAPADVAAAGSWLLELGPAGS